MMKPTVTRLDAERSQYESEIAELKHQVERLEAKLEQQRQNSIIRPLYDDMRRAEGMKAAADVEFTCSHDEDPVMALRTAIRAAAKDQP